MTVYPKIVHARCAPWPGATCSENVWFLFYGTWMERLRKLDSCPAIFTRILVSPSPDLAWKSLPPLLGRLEAWNWRSIRLFVWDIRPVYVFQGLALDALFSLTLFWDCSCVGNILHLFRVKFVGGVCSGIVQRRFRQYVTVALARVQTNTPVPLRRNTFSTIGIV